MKEERWLSATDPSELLALLRGKASERKLRLFAVACCRRLLPLHNDAWGRMAVELAEQSADEVVASEAILTVWNDAHDAPQSEYRFIALECLRAASTDALRAAINVAQWICPPAGYGPCRPVHAEQVLLLRDIFSNPFRPALSIDAAVLAWNDNTVRNLARNIYDERRFEDVPILADALEEAGCTDGELLGHLRSAEAHVRGCFAVDAALGKS